MDLPEIIYEDNEILVAYKPAGIAVQTKRLGQPDMETLLKNYRVRKKEPPYICVVHRLDQPVEGVMVFGKNQKAAASLSAQFREHETGKYYFALGRQKVEKLVSFPGIPESGTLTDYLGYDARKNLGYFSDPEDRASRKAVLEYKIAGEWAEKREICFCIVLHTGRHHQIRLQMAGLGYPLAGDRKYGTTEPGEALALCSCKICFRHPLTGRPMSFFRKPENPLFGRYALEEFA